MKVYQEFYCATSGGGCGGYITVRLNVQLNGVIEVVCPKCQHRHLRVLRDGILTERGRYDSKPVEEIYPTLGAWHKDAQHPDSLKRTFNNERDAVVDISRRFLAEREFELFGGQL